MGEMENDFCASMHHNIIRKNRFKFLMEAISKLIIIELMIIELIYLLKQF
jgi:hypothetical protein